MGLAKNGALKRRARRSMITARWQHRSIGLNQRLFEAFYYTTAIWDCPRRAWAGEIPSSKLQI